MKRMRSLGSTWLLSLLLLASLQLAGCETPPGKEATGTGIGAVLGGIVGSQIGGGRGRTAAALGGVVLGGVIGNAIGKRMDENDRRKMAEALENNRPGQTASWRSQATGTQLAVTPAETFTQNGQQCRRFVQEAVIDGQPKKINGTACKRPEGTTWEET